MRIFVAGATGVLGRNLIPKLLKRGHSVVGTSSTKAKLPELERMGVEPILMNGLDCGSVLAAVRAAHADVVVNEMTALANVHNYKNFDREFALTNQLRRDGTSYLLAAAQASGVQRIVVQSIAGWPLQRSSAPAAREDTPFTTDLPVRMRETHIAIRQMEEMVVSSQSPVGVVLRYGYFYGLGTSFAQEGDVIQAVRKGGLPIIGGGTAVWSLVHVADAAEATRIAIEGAPAGIYHITDDHPATVSEWLTALAELLQAKQPKKIPAWFGRLFVGESGVFLMTRTRGAVNSKAKQVLDWKLDFPDWRQGFAATLRSAS